VADRYLLESGSPDGYLLEDGSGVLLLEGPLPSDDTEVSWWAGAQACFAGVAIAGAALLTSTAAVAQQQAAWDQDWVRAPTGGAPQLIESAKVVQWFSGDELPQFVAPTFPPENDPLPNFSTALVQPQWLTLHHQDEVTQTPTLTVDESYPVPGGTFLPPAQWLTLHLQDEVPQSATPLTVDELYHWTAFQAQPQPVLFVATQQDELGQQVASVPVETDQSLALDVYLQTASGIIWSLEEDIIPQASPHSGTTSLLESAKVVRWSAGDELPLQPTQVVDDAPWSAPVVWQAASKWFAQDLQDEIAQAPANVVDSDGWSPFGAPQQLSFYWPDQPDELPQFWADEEAWIQAPQMSAAFTFTPWSDDDYVAPPGLAADGDDWIVPLLTVTPPRQPDPAIGDDSLITQPPTPLPVDEIYPVDLRAYGVDLSAKAPPTIVADDEAIDFFVSVVNINCSLLDEDDTLSSTYRVGSWRIKKKGQGFALAPRTTWLAVTDDDDALSAKATLSKIARGIVARLQDEEDSAAAGVELWWLPLQVQRTAPRLKVMRSRDWPTDGAAR
jgi:hypothetical protein